MSDINYNSLNHKDKLYFVRMMPKLGYFEIHEVVVATMHTFDENSKPYCTVSDVKTKQTYLLGQKYAEQVLFKDRSKALEFLKEQKIGCKKSYNDLTNDIEKGLTVK